MKAFKSLIGILLVIAMVLSIALPTFAQTTKVENMLTGKNATDRVGESPVKDIIGEIRWEDNVYPGHAPFEFKIKSSMGIEYAITLSEENHWHGTFTDLPMYDSNGEEITYSVVYDLPGYTVTEVEELSGSTEIRRLICKIESDRGTVTIPVEKVWAPDVPEEDIVPVEVDLYVAVGKGTSSSQMMLLSTLTLDESNDWTASFTGFPGQSRTCYYISERETNTVAQYSETRVKLRVGSDNRTVYATQPRLISGDLFWGFDEDQNPAHGWHQDTDGDEFFPNDASDPYIKNGELYMPGSGMYNTSMTHGVDNYNIEPTDYFEIAFVPYVWQEYMQSPMTFLIWVNGEKHSYNIGMISPYHDGEYLVFTTEALGLSGRVSRIGIYVEGYYLRAMIGVDYMFLGNEEIGADAVYEKMTITGRGTAPELNEDLYLADVGKGKITIQNDEITYINRKTFEAYRILDMEIYRYRDGNEIACITYTVPDYLEDFYADRYNLDKNAWNFAEKVQAAIAGETDQEKFLSDIMGPAVASKAYSGNSSQSTYVIADLPLGYYVVEETTLQGRYASPGISAMLAITDPEAVAYAVRVEEEETVYPTDPVSALYFEFDTDEDPAVEWMGFDGKGSLQKYQPYANSGYLNVNVGTSSTLDFEYRKETNYIIQPEDHFEIAFQKDISNSVDGLILPVELVLWLTVDGVLHEIELGEMMPIMGEEALFTEALGLRGYVEKFGIYCKNLTDVAGTFRIDYMYLGSEHRVDSAVSIGHTLELAECITLNYVIPVELLENYDMDTAYLEVMLDDYKGNTYCGTTTYRLLPELRENYYYFTMEEITAVRMNDELKATLHMTKDGQNFCSMRDCYSVSRYAYSQLRKADMSDSLKTLCVDLLAYGAKAQLFKGYRIEKLADADLRTGELAWGSDFNAVVFGNTNMVGNELEDPIITWVGKSLDLHSKVAMIFCVDLSDYAGNPADLTMKVRYTDRSGRETTVVFTEPTPYAAKENCYSFYMDSLLAAELRTVLIAQVYEGEAPISNTLTYSPDTYGNNKTGTLGELCRALFAYSDSAKAYFSS